MHDIGAHSSLQTEAIFMPTGKKERKKKNFAWMAQAQKQSHFDVFGASQMHSNSFKGVYECGCECLH